MLVLNRIESFRGRERSLTSGLAWRLWGYKPYRNQAPRLAPPHPHLYSLAPSLLSTLIAKTQRFSTTASYSVLSWRASTKSPVPRHPRALLSHVCSSDSGRSEAPFRISLASWDCLQNVGLTERSCNRPQTNDEDSPDWTWPQGVCLCLSSEEPCLAHYDCPPSCWFLGCLLTKPQNHSQSSSEPSGNDQPSGQPPL